MDTLEKPHLEFDMKCSTVRETLQGKECWYHTVDDGGWVYLSSGFSVLN